jgi:spore germination protein
MKYKQFICLLLLCVCLVGCIPTRQIEKLAVINTRGTDKLDHDQIETTLEFFQFFDQNSDFSRILTGKGNTVKSAVENANVGSNFALTPEKIQLEIYGKETAKEGIMHYLDTLDRDAILPDSMYLAISDTTANELITTGDKRVTMDIGQFLHGLLEENAVDHLFPRVNFQDFQSSFYDIGKDPYLPLLGFENDMPKLTGIAIMRDDKYVGKTPIADKVYFNLLLKRIKDVNIEVTVPTEPFKKYIEKEDNLTKRSDNMHISSNILKGSSKTKLTDKENLVFETNIKLRLNLVEMSEDVIINHKKVVKLLEKEISKAVQSHYEQLLEQLQEWNADPFEYGAIYRVHKGGEKQLTRKEWRDKFPKITVHFNVDVNVASHGVVD